MLLNTDHRVWLLREVYFPEKSLFSFLNRQLKGANIYNPKVTQARFREFRPRIISLLLDPVINSNLTQLLDELRAGKQVGARRRCGSSSCTQRW